MAQILAMPQAPPIFANLTPESISEETQSLIGHSNALRDEIASNITPATATFKNVVLPLIDDFNQASRRLNILGSLLAEASPDPAIRHSSRAAQKRILAAQSDHAMRGDIAALVGAIYDRAHLSDADHLDAEDWHLLRLMRSEFLRSGSMLLDEEQRQRLRAARAEIDELQLAAVDTITEANGDGIWLRRDELEGMSSKVLGSLDVDCRAEDNRQDTAQTVCFVTFTADHANQMSSLVEDGEVRRKYQAAYRRRCPENVPRLARVVVLRDEVARILGFKNYASMKIEEMMAHSVCDVLETLRTICHRLRLVAKAEDEKLVELKRHEASLDEESSETVLNDWDWSFYARKFRTRNAREHGHKIEEYFEMNYTWTATCGLFEELFQIEFHEITGKVSAWHDSVRVYTVWDGPRRNGDFLGYLYADLIERDGKYQNQRHVLIEPSFILADGSRNYPSSALMCSFPDSTLAKPTLLDLSDVRTLFHELGHCIHNLVSHTKYAVPHSRDYIEIPSVLLEYWAWEPEILTRIGRHYTCLDSTTSTEDGAIPKSLLDSIQANRGCFGASAMLPVLQRAIFDLEIHSPKSHHEAVDMDITSLWNNSRRDLVGQSGNMEDWGWEQAAFGHIFRKYSAGFFAYAMARLYASDIYSSYFADDPLDTARMRVFKRQVLRVGSSKPEAEILEGFMKRKLDTEALFREVLQRSCSQW